MATLTQAEALRLFEYRDGELFWKVKTAPVMSVGDRAGYHRAKGYFYVRFGGKQQALHRVIYLMHHGWIPELVDHIDGNPSNNRIENLRPATKSQNMMNSSVVSNKHGVRNVFYQKKTGKYGVLVTANKNRMYFGFYDDLELADLVAKEARSLYHGEFANYRSNYVTSNYLAN